MAVNFPKIAQIIKGVISDLGEKHQVTLKPYGTTAYSANPGDGPAASTLSYTVNAVVTPTKLSERGQGVDQTMGDNTVLIAGTELTDVPSVGWTCDIDGVQYRIVKIGLVKPGTTTLLYKLTVAR